jgi:hypothetical protein
MQHARARVLPLCALRMDSERDAPWTDCGSMPNTVSLIIKTEEFRGIKPQMNADAPKGIENADKEG